MNWLQKWTQKSAATFRASALLLLLLQIVAPLWHVCALSEHAATSSPSHHTQTVSAPPADPRAPVICFCPAPKTGNNKAHPESQLTAFEKHKHPFCLALLMQALPFQTANAPLFFFGSAASPAIYRATQGRGESRFAGREMGRAPPVWI